MPTTKDNGQPNQAKQARAGRQGETSGPNGAACGETAGVSVPNHRLTGNMFCKNRVPQQLNFEEHNHAHTHTPTHPPAHGTAPHRTAPHRNATQHNTTQHSTAQHNTTQHNTHAKPHRHVKLRSLPDSCTVTACCGSEFVQLEVRCVNSAHH